MPKNARISSGFVANSLPFCVAFRFVWLQICCTISFKFVVPSNISNGSAFYGMSSDTFDVASSMHFFAMTNLDVRFHFNSATFFLSFLTGVSFISKTSPST